MGESKLTEGLRAAGANRISFWLAFALFAASGLLLGMGAARYLIPFVGAAVVLWMFLDIKVALGLVIVYLLAQAPAMRMVDDSSTLYWVFDRADDALLLIVGLAALPHAAGGTWFPKRLRIPFVCLGAAIALGAAGAVLNGNLRSTMVIDAFSLAKGFLVLFAAAHVFAPGDGVPALFRTLGMVAAALGAFGLVDVVLPSAFHELTALPGPLAYRGGFRCLVSIFANEGVAGWFFAAAACLPLAGYLVTRKRVDLVLSVFLLLVSFLSLRRKPVLGILFALGTYLLVRQGAKVRLRVLVALGLIALVVVPTLGDVLSTTFVEAYTGYVRAPEPMRNARNALYIVAFQIAIDYFPLGAGLGLFGGVASRTVYSEFYARYGLSRVWGLAPDDPRFVSDAFYAHLIGALGFLGTALYLAALLLPYATLVRAFNTARNEGVRIAATAAFLIGMEALVEGVAAPVFEASLTAAGVFAASGLAVGAWNREKLLEEADAATGSGLGFEGAR
jgi:hypothetical protein